MTSKDAQQFARAAIQRLTRAYHLTLDRLHSPR